VTAPERFVHEPTGATIRLLPTPRPYASLRRVALRERLAGRRHPALVGGAVAAHVAPYVSTPPRALARVLREERCRALVCQDYENPRFDVAVAVARRLGLPCFGSFQGGDEQHSKLERLTRPLGLRGAAGLLVGPPAEAERLRERYGVPATRITLVPNPVDVARWGAGERARGRSALALPASVRLVAWHGQLQVGRKGLDTLVEAWAAVRARRGGSGGADDRLVLVGAGEDEAALRARIEQAQLEGVHLHAGWMDRDGLVDVLAAADLYVFPSRHEGLAVSPIEALAAGLPVVGTNVRGVAEVVDDAGLLVAPGDAAALADALVALLDDDARRAQLARRAREHAAAAYSLEAVGALLRRTLLGEGL
jgi:starch synthase